MQLLRVNDYCIPLDKLNFISYYYPDKTAPCITVNFCDNRELCVFKLSDSYAELAENELNRRTKFTDSAQYSATSIATRYVVQVLFQNVKKEIEYELPRVIHIIDIDEIIATETNKWLQEVVIYYNDYRLAHVEGEI